MIIILKKGTAPQKVNEMVSHFEQMNFQVQEIRGVHETILGLIGGTGLIGGGAEAVVAALLSTPILLALFQLKKEA